MVKPASLILSLLASLSSVLPALAENEPLPRTPWQKAEPAPGQAVRWVVEGCAAYPVIIDADTEATGSEPAPDIIADAAHRPPTR